MLSGASLIKQQEENRVKKERKLEKEQVQPDLIN